MDYKEHKTIGHLVVITGDYPTKGHQRYVFVQQLVEAFCFLGIRVTVVAPQSVVHSIVHGEKTLPRYTRIITRSGNDYEVYRPYILSSGNTQRFKIVLDIWNNHILRRLLDKLKPDTLYTHFWSSAMLVSKYAKEAELPLFVACGEGDNALEELVQETNNNVLARLKSVVTGVISVSSENMRKCIEYQLIQPDSIGVFPNGVDTDLFKQSDKKQCREKLGLSDEDFVVLFVGVFSPRKGPDRVADAVSRICDPKIKIYFIGKEFPGYPFDFNCPGTMYKGPADHKDLPIFLNAADVFVLPTQKEGCCNAIVEALAVGIPIISSNGAFNDDILDNFNSIRIDPNNIVQIADAIVKLKNDIGLRRQMCHYSIARHDKYSIQERAKKILAFIEGKLSV